MQNITQRTCYKRHSDLKSRQRSALHITFDLSLSAKYKPDMKHSTVKDPNVSGIRSNIRPILIIFCAEIVVSWKAYVLYTCINEWSVILQVMRNPRTCSSFQFLFQPRMHVCITKLQLCATKNDHRIKYILSRQPRPAFKIDLCLCQILLFFLGFCLKKRYKHSQTCNF